MNDTQMLNWLEEQGELIIHKPDGKDYIVITRQNGLVTSTEYPTLRSAITEMMNDYP